MVEKITRSLLLLHEVETFATPFLELGRGGWDLAHTKAVVYYAGLLAKEEDQDIQVLQVTAWLHDIGYFGQFSEGEGGNYKVVKDKKKIHMLIGAEKSREFLERDEIKDLLTTAQKERIIHLVGIHDDLERLVDPDEIVFMEADTLGAIDLSRVTPSFDKNGLKNYIAGLKERRGPRFRTNLGTTILSQLLPRIENYDPEN
jgi:putative nucleotidyltransferase with HDIG domain